ncbi:MAG TPA: sugar phosphate isomerase/epimerase [Bryobacteraceae bacterium]|jgi:sugar phosphate isomerase/epimerase|nr:sugar phosphate isomerase/epimerase [Bryobacteraceae bacterium]
MSSQPTRRSLLAGSAATLISASAVSAKTQAIRFGGPIFLQSDDPEQLAQEHRRLGYSAAYCPPLSLSDSDRIRATAKAFGDANVVIAEVGAWKNMLDPDTAKRRENLAYVTERCALAEAVGARCCVDIAGSYNPDVWYGPNPKNLSKEFFDATVENCRHIIDSVKPKRTKFTIEMMGWNLPDGPDSYLRLIHAVDRSAFAVHLDVCNGVNCPKRFYENSAFIGECFSKLGPWITSCHAKDLQWIVELNVHFAEVVPGRGQIDYARYLNELSKLPVDVPLMMEHLKTPEEYLEGAHYIRKVGAAHGIAFV